jgi:cell division septal protein FtsQ
MWGFHHIIQKLSIFNVSRVVVTGNINLDEEFLKEIAVEFLGINLYSVPLKTVSSKYDAVTRIKKINVRRVFPNRLRLIVQERESYMYLKTREGLLIPIDEQYTVLDRKESYLLEDLPIIHTDFRSDELATGARVDDDKITLIFGIHELFKESELDEHLISEYYMEDDDLRVIEVNTGSEIRLGNDGYPDKIKKLAFVWENFGFENKQIVDLRFKDQVVMLSEGIR